MWYTAIITTTILVLLVIMLSPVKVEIKYSYYKSYTPGENTPRENAPDRGIYFSVLWGLINFRLRLSYFKLAYRAFPPAVNLRARLSKPTGQTVARKKTRLTPNRTLQLYTRAVNIYKATAPAYRYLLRKTTLHHFKWSTGLGLPEAGQTGLAVGALWAIKGNATSILYRMLGRLAVEPELEVRPEFDRPLLRVNLHCILSVQAGHIIYTGLLAGCSLLFNRRKLYG